MREEALKVASKFKMGPIFTPPVWSKPEGPYGTLSTYPDNGGTNWPGGSFDPETHIAYLPSQRLAVSAGVVPGDPKVTDMRFVKGSAAPKEKEGEGQNLLRITLQGIPLVKPPYASITAIDLNRGNILWKIAHGDTPDNIRNHPALKGLDIPRTGRPGFFGVLVTKTVVIAGERGTVTTPSGSQGALLRAYDKATGRDVGSVPMPAGATGTPMTYMLNGVQYVVLALGGPGFPAELIAYRLAE